MNRVTGPFLIFVTVFRNRVMKMFGVVLPCFSPPTWVPVVKVKFGCRCPVSLLVVWRIKNGFRVLFLTRVKVEAPLLMIPFPFPWPVLMTGRSGRVRRGPFRNGRCGTPGERRWRDCSPVRVPSFPTLWLMTWVLTVVLPFGRVSPSGLSRRSFVGRRLVVLTFSLFLICRRFQSGPVRVGQTWRGVTFKIKPRLITWRRAWQNRGPSRRLILVSHRPPFPQTWVLVGIINLIILVFWPRRAWGQGRSGSLIFRSFLVLLTVPSRLAR